MLALFIKTYFSLLLTIFISSITIFSLGMYCLLRRFCHRYKQIETHQDLSAIAGDDLIATQLDLARAYIETNQKQLATTILEVIVMQGSASQREEAKELMNFI